MTLYKLSIQRPVLATVMSIVIVIFGLVSISGSVCANHAREDFPETLAAIATSLRVATSRTIDRSTMAAAILRELDARYADLDRRFDQLVAEASRKVCCSDTGCRCAPRIR